MKIKVKYQGQVVGEIDFQAFSAIVKMRELGYASFMVRSEVNTHESFASFVNEDNDCFIKFFPDGSFMKEHNCRVTSKELETIIYVLNYHIFNKIEEESE